MTKSVPQHLIDAILDKTSIVELIGQILPLKRSGANHVTVCPFHGDKDPSFNVSEARQFFHCFGCGESGDSIAFLMKYHGYTFREALSVLADRAGVELAFEEADGRPDLGERRDYVELNAFATRFYQERLEASADARAYLTRRRIEPATATRFGLGYAPAEWGALADAITRLGHDALRKAETLGLIRPRKSGSGYIDLFRDRLQFPVYNQDGKVVGFSGRTLGNEPDAPKYVNSPDSHLYHKGRLLFGLHQAREGIRRTNRTIVVEGNVDVVAMHQAGLDETVAPLGTALTPQQASLLGRVSREVVLLFDGDAAGIRAGFRTLKTLLQASIHPRLALLPEGDDPDSFLETHEPTALKELVDQARPGMDVLIDWHLEQRERSQAGLARAVEEVLPYLRDLQSGVERELYGRRLAERAGVDARTVLAEVRYESVVARPTFGLDKYTTWALALFRVCVEEPALLGQLTEERLALISDPALRDLFHRAAAGVAAHGDLRPDIVAEASLPDGLRHRFVEAFFDEPQGSDEDRLNTFRALLGRLQKAAWDAEYDQNRQRLARLNEHPAENWDAIRDLMARQTELRERVRVVNEYLDRVTRRGRAHAEEVH